MSSFLLDNQDRSERSSAPAVVRLLGRLFKATEQQLRTDLKTNANL
jgi:hypothetical protein